MTGEYRKRIHLLVVDDDQFLCTTLGFALHRCFPPGAEIHNAGSLTEAATLMTAAKFDAIVVDQCLPDGHGTDLLRCILQAGGSPSRLFLMSGRDPNEFDITALIRQHPGIVFIEKPFLFDVVARRVREAVIPHEDGNGGHYGLELFHLVQAYSLARKNATLRVLLPDERMGMVSLRDGELVHAILGALEGKDALCEIVRMGKGRIHIDEVCATARRTILAPTQQVLIDTLRILDEEANGARAPVGRADEDTLDEMFADFEARLNPEDTTAPHFDPAFSANDPPQNE